MKPRIEESFEIVSRFPASVAQERCWVMEQMHPGNKGLNLAIRWELRGTAPAALVEDAFQRIVDRHEILRTRFAERDGQIWQEVVDHAAFRLTQFDLRQVPEPDQEARIHAIAVEHSAERFDLAQPLLFRVAMVRQAPERATLLVSVHNSVFDGFSIGVTGTEFGTILAALIEGREPELPDLPLHYGDYALWLRDFAQSPAMAEEESYWCNHLKDMRYFEVPGARPRRAGAPELASFILPMPASFNSAIEAASRRLGVSVFSLGTAAVAAALARFTGQGEVSFAFQDSGRDDVDLEPLIGVFTNPLVLRLPVSGTQSLVDLAQSTRATIEEALANRHLPFDRLVQKLNPPRDPLRIPLVSIMFNLQRVFLVERSYGPFEMVSVPSHSPGTMYDLHINLIGRKTGWKLLVDYNKALFDEGQIAEFSRLYIEALRRMTEAPESPVAELPLNQGAARPDAVLPSDGGMAAAVSEQIGAPAQATPGPKADPAAETTASRAAEVFAARSPDRAHEPLASPLPAAFAPDESEDFRALRHIWAELLGLPPEKVSGDFFDLGGYSVLALRMLAKLGERFGTRPSLYQFLADPTLTGVAALVGIETPKAGARPTEPIGQAQALAKPPAQPAPMASASPAPGTAPPESAPPLAQRKAERADPANQVSAAPSRAPSAEAPLWSLFELRRAKAGAPVLLTINQTFLYQAVSRDIAAEAVVANLVLPDAKALARQEALGFDRAMELAADQVLARYSERPLLLCGLCVDGRLAMRLAQILSARGHQPACVAMIDTWAPGETAAMSALSRFGDRWITRAKRAAHYLGLTLRGKLSVRDFFGQFRLTRALTGYREAEPEMAKLVADTVDQLVRQTRRYSFAPYDGAVILFTTDAQHAMGRDGVLGWSRLLAADLVHHPVSGWHGDAVARSGFDRIALVLDARLRRLGSPLHPE